MAIINKNAERGWKRNAAFLKAVLFKDHWLIEEAQITFSQTNLFSQTDYSRACSKTIKMEYVPLPIDDSTLYLSALFSPYSLKLRMGEILPFS